MYKYDKYFCYLGYLPMFLLGNIVFLVFNMILLIPILIMKIYTSLLTRNPIKFIESVLFDPYIILKDIFKSFPIF